MLLATYQNLPTSFWTDSKNYQGDFFADIAAYNRKTYFNLDFAPIWCFSAESIKTAQISSMFSAPNEPAALFFINTDNFVRIDKVKWYQQIKDAAETNTLPITTSTDDLHSEFVISGDTFLRDHISVTAFIPLFSNLSIITEQDVRDYWKFISAPEWYEMCTDGFAEDISMVAMAWIKELKNFKAIPNPGKSSAHFNRHKMFFISKSIFEAALLPICVQLAQNKDKISNISLYATLFTIHEILCENAAFSNWSYSDCNLSEYDCYLSNLSNLLVDDWNVLCALNSGERPGRNELCPCGSGKKWKKCHGRYLK